VNSEEAPRDLTVLSFGAGQESTLLFYLLAEDAEFRARWAPGTLIVVGCDTGDEHPETYAHLKWCAEYAEKKKILFLWVTAFPERFGNASWVISGFHSEAWMSIIHQYRRNSSFGSKLFSRTCTDNVKIGPFYRALASIIGGARGEPARKVFDNYFARTKQRIGIILGFARGEEGRAAKTRATMQNPKALPAWRRNNFVPLFPLIDDPKTNWNRAESQSVMRRLGLPVPVPSNCLRCHFRGPVELLWLSRNHPKAFAEWVEIEEAKKKKYRELGRSEEKNLGVFGKRSLPEELKLAQTKHGHLTDEQLEEYRMSHGHCVSNSF